MVNKKGVDVRLGSGRCKGYGLGVLTGEIAPLSDVFQVAAGVGALVGGIVGFAVRAETDRRMLENVALGTALGGCVGLLLGFAIWLGSIPA